MIPEMARLKGLPVSKAGLYGLPHIGARYTGAGARDCERTQGWCAVCGKPAANCHHVVPLSVRHRFGLATPSGTVRLRSPLFALCGSGTEGCHGAFHAGRIKARWLWDSADDAELWWSGELIARYGPHHPALYRHGRWEIDDSRTGRVSVIREGV